jgi:hypothetical protein
MMRLGPNSQAYCNPDLLAAKERRRIRDLTLSASTPIAALAGHWALNTGPANHSYTDLLKERMEMLAWPLDYRAGQRTQSDKSTFAFWMSPSALYVAPNTVGHFSLLSDLSYAPPNWASLLAHPNPLPDLPADTPYIVCLAPELGADASAHVRLHVYEEIHSQLRYLLGWLEGKRTEHTQVDFDRVLAPVHAGRLMFPEGLRS